MAVVAPVKPSESHREFLPVVGGCVNEAQVLGRTSENCAKVEGVGSSPVWGFLFYDFQLPSFVYEPAYRCCSDGNKDEPYPRVEYLSQNSRGREWDDMLLRKVSFQWLSLARENPIATQKASNLMSETTDYMTGLGVEETKIRLGISNSLYSLAHYIAYSECTLSYHSVRGKVPR
jgi:hypothetical protein